MKLNRKSQTIVRKTGREMNISKDKAHRLMHDIIGFKPHIMHCTQQFYDGFTYNVRYLLSSK